MFCKSRSNNKRKKWQYQFKYYLSNINLMEMTDRYDTFLQRNVCDKILNASMEVFISSWHTHINSEVGPSRQGRNKLKTYRVYKKSYETEEYVKSRMSKNQRSALAKLRCGVAPIRLETGRYENIQKNLTFKIPFYLVLPIVLSFGAHAFFYLGTIRRFSWNDTTVSQ
jgi:hypothetical protein